MLLLNLHYNYSIVQQRLIINFVRYKNKKIKKIKDGLLPVLHALTCTNYDSKVTRQNIQQYNLQQLTIADQLNNETANNCSRESQHFGQGHYGPTTQNESRAGAKLNLDIVAVKVQAALFSATSSIPKESSPRQTDRQTHTIARTGVVSLR